MTRNDGKIKLWVQRYKGGLIGDRKVLIGPSVVALLDFISPFEKGWGELVKFGWLDRTDAYCEGSFEVAADRTTRLVISTSGTSYEPEDVVWLIRRAFTDNRDEARYCGNPLIFVNGSSYGFAR